MRLGLGMSLASVGVSYPPIVFSAPQATIAPLCQATFAATGGSGSFSYAITTNNTGGSINSGSGVYTCGATGEVIDTVTVTDTNSGKTAAASITSLINPVSLSPTLWLHDIAGMSAAAWNDQSGNGRNFANAVGAQQPSVVASINGRNCQRFNGTSSWLNASGLALSSLVSTTAWTVFMALKDNGSAALPGSHYQALNLLAAWGTLQWGIGVASTVFECAQYDGSYHYTEGPAYSSAAGLLFSQLNGGTISQNFANGASSTVATGAIATPATGGMSIGQCQAGGGTFFKGDLGEIVVYNTALSGANITKLRAYFASKWAI